MEQQMRGMHEIYILNSLEKLELSLILYCSVDD